MKYLLLIIVVLLFGCIMPPSERVADYVDLQSYNIAGTGNFIFVVTRDYVFTDEQSAKDFYDSIQKREVERKVK